MVEEKYNYGSNEEIAYRFFLLGCKTELKRAFETLLETQDAAVAIHCHAGKDRTGIFISMVHLLIETPLEIVFNDYLASESDTKKHNLDLVLEIINQEGGIENYLRSCGLTMLELKQLKNQLLDGNQYELKSFFTEHWKYMAVSTACKLNLFDNLQEAKTAKQLATELSLNEEKLLLLINALHNANFLKKNEDLFSINSVSELLLENNPR